MDNGFAILKENFDLMIEKNQKKRDVKANNKEIVKKEIEIEIPK